MKFEQMTLEEKQALPYRYKKNFALKIIDKAHDVWDGHVANSFSGGRDSLCVQGLCDLIDPEMDIVFFDTGIEAPEIIEKITEYEPRLRRLKPAHSFYWTLKNKGFPLISKQQSQYIARFRSAMKRGDKEQMMLRLFGGKNPTSGEEQTQGRIYKKYHYYAIHGTHKVSDECCNTLKKYPAQRYYKETGNLTFIGTKAVDSMGRRQFFKKYSCFREDANPPQAYPIHFWLEKDVDRFLKESGLKLATIYDMGFDRTGCMFCGYGLDQEKKNSKDGLNRFERMETTHPKMYDKIMNKYGLKEALRELEEMTGLTPDYYDAGLNIRQQLPLL
jgi:3'-phosphoadenosine 5'-phosphosulfate sulfotransferase (PAPS reductase)/FAD synthetase